MTGYGKQELAKDNKTITVELKSLNSRYLDLNMRMPPGFREFELEVRNMLSKLLVRGKIDLLINIDSSANGNSQHINTALLQRYISELDKLSKEYEVNRNDLFMQALRMPNVVEAATPDVSNEDWNDVLRMIDRTANHLDEHRVAEGLNLAMDLTERVYLIKSKGDEIERSKAGRLEKVKQRITQHLAEQIGEEKVDQNRFEQELIFYLEKLDITEELVRLNTHCDYFLQVLDNQETSKGRKLEFITQEIGREINTIGSKANDATIQKVVVEMKDELEKVKEQCANLL
jgi:uncharacterized protein (TIGR00255 family)